MHTFVNERMTLDSSTMLLQLRNRYWRKIDERKLGNCRLILSKNRLNFRFRLTQSNTISELNHTIIIFFCGKSKTFSMSWHHSNISKGCKC